MNKLYKCALGLLTTFILTCCCFSSAANIALYDGMNTSYSNTNEFINPLYNQSSNDIYLLCIGNRSSSTLDIWYDNHKIVMKSGNYPDICLGLNNDIYSVSVIVAGSQDYSLYNVKYMKSSNFTSLECQTEFNLIPISEVTANYCKLNFDLIDPAECPINSGTGTIVRSNLTINNTPYAQNQNINVFIPDFLAWNVAFNDFNTVIEVEGYNADESYIENVISNEKLTPTNEDFEEMLTGFMTNYFPYLALALVFLYLARKIFKLFK